MKQELDDKLCNDYPEIFQDRNGNPMQTAMCWGFECGDGWYELIDTLCKTIQNHCKFSGFQVIATQVKEKYGGLRFYTLNSDDYVDGMIALAEAYSLQICEECGSTEDVFQTTGWVKTICKKCDTKIKNEKHISKESNTRKRSRKR